MAEHDWTPFTEDLVICTQCGDTCDEAASESEWTAECTPDPLLHDDGGDFTTGPNHEMYGHGIG